MKTNPVQLIGAAVMCMLVTAVHAQMPDAKLQFVRLRIAQPLTAGIPPKLSSALIATRDANGVLNGVDDTGRLIITVPNAFLARLRNSMAVERVEEQPPPNWNSVKKLKLSYAGNPPTEGELKAIGLKLIEDYKEGSFLIVEPVSKQIDAQLVSRLERTEKIKFATASLRLKAIPPTNPVTLNNVEKISVTTPNDPRLNELWGMQNIHAPAAWPTVHDSSVVVAVIDTGIDYNHEDLRDNIWSDAKGKHGYDFVEDDDDPMDQAGHGTHCSGTIGAVGNNSTGVVGVNWKVKIMGVRWLDANGSGEIVNAIKSIDFAVDHGAKILSNSWYWPEDDPDLQAAIRRAEAENVLFVAAAGNFAEIVGNNGGDNDIPSTRGRYPSCYPVANIIAVAAIDVSDHRASFSEWGKKTVHIGAPGVNILSTVPHNDYDGTYSGTSMATPHVAGAAALIMSATGAQTATDVKKQLLDHARKIDDLRNKCVTEGTLDIGFLSKPQQSAVNPEPSPTPGGSVGSVP
jgi:subtilisin family serine protease